MSDDIVIYGFRDEIPRGFAERLLYSLTTHLWQRQYGEPMTEDTRLTHDFIKGLGGKQYEYNPQSIDGIARALANALGYWVESREGHNLLPFYPDDTPDQAERRRLMYDEQLVLMQQYRDLTSKYDLPSREQIRVRVKPL